MKKFKVRFATLFPNFDTVHFTKDVGMIGYYLAHCFNYKVCFFGYQDEKYMNTYLQTSMPEFRYKCVKDVNVKSYIAKGILRRVISGWWQKKLKLGCFFIRNAKKIDVLHLFHLHSATTQEFIRYYKFFNPNGIVYVKTDLRWDTFEELLQIYHEKQEDKYGLKYILENADIISAETKELVDQLSKKFQRKIIYVPNGCFELSNWKVKCEDKENIFITVADLRMKVKRIPMIVDAFIRSSEEHDWKLMLVGTYDIELEQYINIKTEEHTWLKDRIVMPGNIKDREDLYNLYRKSKVYVCGSNVEGFSISIVEALYNGCYIICSDGVSPVADMIPDSAFGRIFERGNVDELSNAMTESTNICYSQKMVDNIRAHYFNNFSYRKSVEKLNEEIILTRMKNKKNA